MTEILKVTKRDRTIARQGLTRIGQSEARCRSFRFYVGERYGFDDPDTTSVNMLLVDSDPYLNNSDLFDNSHPLDRVLDAIPLDENGEATLDIYIYEPPCEKGEDHGDLLCNGGLYFDRNGLKRVTDWRTTVWERS